MKTLVALTLALALTTGLAAPVWAATDMAELKAAEKEYKEADRQLNVAYKALMAVLEAPARPKLQAAELAWIQFRDKQADFTVALFTPEHDLKTIRIKNLTELTRERTKALQGAKEFYENY